MKTSAKKKYNYILLDWDGNLARTLDVWMMGYQKLFPQYNLFPSEEEIVDKVFGRGDNGPRNLGIRDSAEFYERLMSIIEPKLEMVDLYDEVPETLIKIKESGRKLGVLTSSEKRYVLKAIEKNGLSGVFDSVITGDEVQERKPHPESIFKMIEALGGKYSEALIVGDSDKDVLAGQNAKIDSVLFLPEENKRFYKEIDLLELGPDYIIRKFGSLLEIL